MSDEAVKAKTGKTWAEWFAILDRAGGRNMNHKHIVAHIDQNYPIDGWWCQMVTVAYEQARGLRDLHEKPDGYEISASKTLNVPLATLFRAWQDESQRRRWLPEPIITRKATTDKSMRIGWSDGKTRVSANFYAKGETRSMVAVQHGKLASARDGDRMKAHWAAALERLKSVLKG